MSLLESLARRIEDADALDSLADVSRDWAHEMFVARPALDDLLGGSWLGHRVHPIAVQVPMGAWLMAVLLDLVDGERHAAAVDALLATGCATAIPTAVTGAHDLATTTGAATRVTVVHAASMDASLVLFATAWVSRRRGDRRRARRLALAGITVASAGAYLGGHLTYRLGVGVED
ncbi:DUF2231 domain-containing protein [Nocardioides sediminis]|uniref:DUF2231 domain-containing protein n=1 Tax=Nocardioides sediminis TaxID=433648 RepID=UPI000D31F702|nr:DUF2231 domain-containing protein [Nocardioides sediminis]